MTRVEYMRKCFKKLLIERAYISKTNSKEVNKMIKTMNHINNYKLLHHYFLLKHDRIRKDFRGC